MASKLGVKEVAIRRYESGNTVPPIHVFAGYRRLATAHGVDLEGLAEAA